MCTLLHLNVYVHSWILPLSLLPSLSLTLPSSLSTLSHLSLLHFSHSLTPSSREYQSEDVSLALAHIWCVLSGLALPQVLLQAGRGCGGVHSHHQSYHHAGDPANLLSAGISSGQYVLSTVLCP